MLDTTVTSETPEGMLLELNPAGLSPRFHAFVADWLLRLVVLLFGALLAESLGGLGTGFWLVALFLAEWIYPIAFELSAWGATPGKRMLGLRVVMENGLPVTPAASFARNLLRAADFLPFAYAIAIVTMLIRADGRRLGDLAAGTLVVADDPVQSVSPVADELVPMAPVIPLSLADQGALVALAARASTLTVERVDELAALAAAVSGDQGRSGPEVTARVLGVAQWLIGRRR